MTPSIGDPVAVYDLYGCWHYGRLLSTQPIPGGYEQVVLRTLGRDQHMTTLQALPQDVEPWQASTRRPRSKVA